MQARASAGESELEQKRDSTSCSDNEVNSKVYKILADESYQPPDGITL
jgi:hypothetical protein